jgi:hypothetical protein
VKTVADGEAIGGVAGGVVDLPAATALLLTAAPCHRHQLNAEWLVRIFESLCQFRPFHQTSTMRRSLALNVRASPFRIVSDLLTIDRRYLRGVFARRACIDPIAMRPTSVPPALRLFTDATSVHRGEIFRSTIKIRRVRYRLESNEGGRRAHLEDLDKLETEGSDNLAHPQSLADLGQQAPPEIRLARIKTIIGGHHPFVSKA